MCGRFTLSSTSRVAEAFDPEFLEREEHFRNHDRALAWQHKNLARLLRA